MISPDELFQVLPSVLTRIVCEYLPLECFPDLVYDYLPVESYNCDGYSNILQEFRYYLGTEGGNDTFDPQAEYLGLDDPAKFTAYVEMMVWLAPRVGLCAHWGGGLMTISKPGQCTICHRGSEDQLLSWYERAFDPRRGSV